MSPPFVYSMLVGTIEDGTNGDTADDHYHRYMVCTLQVSMEFKLDDNLVINVKWQLIVVVDIPMDLGICSTT